MNLTKKATKIALIGAFLIPFIANAQIQITEIMYDLEGSDSKKEWIEICNLGSEEINITGYKFNDGSNHNINEPPKNGGQGSLNISSQECAILTGNAETFLNLHSGYSGIVIDTVMSLNNTEDILSILNLDLVEVDSVTYNNEMGASGDGNSLQKTDSGWEAGIPTPGEILSYDEDSNGGEASQEEASPRTIDGQAVVAPKQTIFADAGENKTVIVGADTFFKGRAYGLKGELLENASYIWNFGDGTIKKEKNVLHSYSYPGEYIVFFDVSSGVFTNSDRLEVTALQADLIISNIKLGVNGFVELHNKTDRELDLSWWRLSNGNTFFTIPKNTFISAGNKIIFSSDNTGLIITNKEVKLLYPNGSLASEYGESVGAGSQVVQTTKVSPLPSPSAPPRGKTFETNSSSRSDLPPQILDEALTNPESQINKASVIDSLSNIEVKGQRKSENIYKWLLATSMIVLIGVISILLQKSKSDENIEKISEEIDVI